jgi:hypothetical protein
MKINLEKVKTIRGLQRFSDEIHLRGQTLESVFRISHSGEILYEGSCELVGRLLHVAMFDGLDAIL